MRSLEGRRWGQERSREKEIASVNASGIREIGSTMGAGEAAGEF